MKKSALLLLSIWLITSCGAPADNSEKEEAKPLPNIVLLVGDDQGYPYFGFMGADYVQTPNMDKLAASGVVFTQGYVPDNHCRPSLQTLMTGTLPIQYEQEVKKLIATEVSNGTDANAQWERDFRFHAMKNFRTLPRLLADKGYTSFQGGKWWEFNYQNGGFNEGMTKGWNKEDEGDPEWFQQFMGGDGTELARATMQPVYDFVNENTDQPFFIWYAPELPHYPFDAPDKYYNLYKDQDMTESAKRYYANCTWFDDGVGELIRFLKEKGEFENTLFVYVNDNGWEQNPDQEFRSDSLRWHNGGDKGKLSIYDQSFRTPIIFSWPGQVPAKQVKADLMHSADIPATILDFLDMPVPVGYHGMSYKSVIEGKASNPREHIIGNVTQIRWEGDMMGKNIEGYWLRNQDWFFKWNKTDNIKALFDMKADPMNNKDLSGAEAEKVAEFSSQIDSWIKENGE